MRYYARGMCTAEVLASSRELFPMLYSRLMQQCWLAAEEFQKAFQVQRKHPSKWDGTEVAAWFKSVAKGSFADAGANLAVLLLIYRLLQYAISPDISCFTLLSLPVYQACE